MLLRHSLPMEASSPLAVLRLLWQMRHRSEVRNALVAEFCAPATGTPIRNHPIKINNVYLRASMSPLTAMDSGNVSNSTQLAGLRNLCGATCHAHLREAGSALNAAIAQAMLSVENYCGREARYAVMSTMSSSVRFSTAGFMIAAFLPCRAPVL